jgi:hypothetical protein
MMMFRSSLTQLASTIGFGMVILVTACSSSAKTFCDAAQQCSGGNDKDVAACVETRDGARDIAKAYDCLDSYNKVSDCTETKSSCNNKSYTASGCQAEAAAYGACINAASTKRK